MFFLFFTIYIDSYLSCIFYSKFLRLLKVRYSTVSLIKELHIYSFKLLIYIYIVIFL